MAIIPDTNINLSNNIGAVLRDAGGGVVINSPVTYFGGPARINKDAKYKPVILNANFTDNISDWWKGYDGQCGYSINWTTEEGLEQFLDDLLANENYMYDYRPIRNENRDVPLRLSDFVRYNTDCGNWLTQPADKLVTISDKEYFYATLYNPSKDIPYNLNITDISVNGTPFKDSYIGVILWNYHNNVYTGYCSINTIGQMYRSSTGFIQFQVTASGDLMFTSGVGEYLCAYIVCSKRNTSFNPLNWTGTFSSLPINTFRINAFDWGMVHVRIQAEIYDNGTMYSENWWGLNQTPEDQELGYCTVTLYGIDTDEGRREVPLKVTEHDYRGEIIAAHSQEEYELRIGYSMPTSEIPDFSHYNDFIVEMESSNPVLGKTRYSVMWT